MDYRSGIGLNGLHLPHLPPPDHPIAPSGLYYHLSPSSGCQKNPALGSSSQLHLSNATPRTCATIQPSAIPKRDDVLENGGASSFAAALRNLAKNVGMNSTASSNSSSSSTSSTSPPNSNDHSNKSIVGELKIQSPAQSALLDVRKGFDRQAKHVGSNQGLESVPVLPPSTTSLLSKSNSHHHSGDVTRESGFQPYRSSSSDSSIINSQQGIVNSTTSPSSNKFIPPPSYSYPLFGSSHIPYPVSYEASALYRAQYETYMASIGASPVMPISTAYPGGTFPQKGESSSPQLEQSKPSSSSRKDQSKDDEEQPPPSKKKCLFVRPFEDNYSSQKKPSNHMAFKEPVMNATAYHPPSTYIQSKSPIKQEDSNSKQEEKGIRVIETNDMNHNIERAEIISKSRELKNTLECLQVHSDKKSSLIVKQEDDILSDQKESAIENSMIKNNSLINKDQFQKNSYNRKRKVLSDGTNRSLSPMKEEINAILLRDSSSTPSLSLPSTPPHLNKLPECHAKSMYLNVIGLTRVLDNKKQEREDIWNAALDDRLYRNSISTTTKYLIRLRNMNPVKTSPKSSLGFLPPSLISKLSKPAVPRKTHLITTTNNALSLPKLPIDLGSLVPVSKSLLNEVKNSETVPPIIVTTQMNTPTSSTSAILNVGSNTFELKSVAPAWTGIENVIEGYKKFHGERENEITKLNQQLNMLKQEEVKKRSQFDSFTSQMATTVRYKNLLKNKRTKLKENIKEMIDLLKKIKKL